MPSIQFLALWTVVSELQTADLEAFSRWLWSAQSGAAPQPAGPLSTLMAAALKLSREDLSALSDFVVGAIESRYEGA